MLLDTSAIVSYFKGNESASPVATAIMEEFVATGRNQATVSAVSAMELLVDPLRMGTGGLALYQQVMLFLMHMLNLRVVSVDLRVAHEAASLRATLGLKPPDALVMATGRSVAARHFVTNDQEWKRKLRPPLTHGTAVCYLEDHLPYP